MNHTKRFLTILWEEIGCKIVAAVAIGAFILGPSTLIGWLISRQCTRPMSFIEWMFFGLIPWMLFLFLVGVCVAVFFYLVDKWEEAGRMQP